MSDIVERLRFLCACIPGCDGSCTECPDTVAWNGADEIERLRKDNAGLVICVDMARESSMGHQELAAIFRRALQDISNATLADYQTEIARAALAKEFDDE